MLEKTGNLRPVQELLGHESIMTMQRYVHPEIKGVAALVNERNSNNAKENLPHSGKQIQRKWPLSPLGIGCPTGIPIFYIYQ
jgi:hypothetical protein